MRDRLIEMKQWCDEVMREEDEEDDCEGAEDEKVLSKAAVLGLMQMLMQDDDGGYAGRSCERGVGWEVPKHSFQVSLWQRLSDSSLWKQLLLQAGLV